MCPPSKMGSGSRLTIARLNVMRIINENPPLRPSSLSLYQSIMMIPSGPLIWRTCILLADSSPFCAPPRLFTLLVSGEKSSCKVRPVCSTTLVNCRQGLGWAMTLAASPLSCRPIW